MDAACLPALAVIGRAVLPPSLAERYRLLERGKLDEAAADEVRGRLDELAGILTPREGA